MTLRPASRVLLLGLLGLPAPASAQSPGPYTSFYEGVRALSPDPQRGATVTGLRLERDAGTLHFEDGQLHMLAPIGGRTPGAVFVGRGRFEMAAPDAVEQGQLRRALGTDDVARGFRAAVLLFTDGTQAELEEALGFAPLEPSADARREVQEARDYFTDSDGWVGRDVALPLLNGGPGWFYAHVSEDRADPLIFEVDPHSFEEVSLSRRAQRAKSREVVARFHRRADYETGRSIPQEGLDLVTVSSYEIDTAIDRDLDLVGRATAQLHRNQRFYRWVPFRLFSGLEVDSIRWGDGSSAAFARVHSDLWVDFSTAPGDDVALTFHYSGDMMERPNDLWVVLGTHTTWYPVYELGRAIPYRLTFRTPDRFVLNTVGTRLSETTAERVTVTEWETPPVRMLTFNLGEFES